MTTQSKPLTVYLADLCYVTKDGLSKDSLPLGIGTIAAYAVSNLATLGVECKVRLFITADDLMDAVRREAPDVVGFANFIWSEQLTSRAVKAVRALVPSAIIVTGGANISPHSLRQDKLLKRKIILDSYVHAQDQDRGLLKEFLDVDYFIHGEGEVPFFNLCLTWHETGGIREHMTGKCIAGCSAFNPATGKLEWGEDVEDIRDLDVIPSPYIMGLYEPLWEKYKLIPQIETNRGCPFNCTFCTVGSWDGKVRKHSIQYVRRELDYLRKSSPSKILRFADSNFGLVGQDVEIAKMVEEFRRDYGFPIGIRLYTAESGVNSRVKECMKFLSDMIPLNLSVQSVSETVARNIMRKNQTLDDIADMRRFANQYGMMMSTELICGLPGETLESYTEGFDRLLELGFESITAYPLILIRGADLDTPQSRKRWDFRTRFAYLGQNSETFQGELVFEHSELPVSSNSYSEQDYFDMLAFSYFMFFMMRGGWYRELLLYAIENDVKGREIFDELRSGSTQYRMFDEALFTVLEKLRNCYFESVESLSAAILEAQRNQERASALNYRTQLSVSTAQLLSSEHAPRAVDEVVGAIRGMILRARNDHEAVDFELGELRRYTLDKMIAPFEVPQEEVVFRSKLDILSWLAQSPREYPLGSYTGAVKPIRLRVRNLRQHRDLHDITHATSYARRMHYYFETVTGSNMQRLAERFDSDRSLDVVTDGIGEYSFTTIT
jgi:radical SAM superfamily enzyme YgiQ (UPF0313 family)